MHDLVQRIMRGVIFCVVTIAVTACVGVSDVPDSGNGRDNAHLRSQDGLPRIDAIRLRVANNALENRDYNTAIRFYESVRRSSPSNAAAAIGIARAHLGAGNHKEAVAAYRALLDLDSDNEEALDSIGRALVLNGQYKEAIEYFERSLAQAPSAALHNRLGVAYDLMGDGERAQEHYRAALALDPEAISPRNNLALSLAISESYAEAIKEMERVVAHPQATEKHRQNLAFVYGMAGENDEALAGLSESGLTPSEIARNRALYKRIRAHARAGNRAAILEYLRNGSALGEPALADGLSEPADPYPSMASARPDRDMSSTGNVVTPPTALKNKEVSPARPTTTEAPKVAKLPARRKSSRVPAVSSMLDRVGDAFYRVQLAAYRTSRTAIRGIKVLHSILLGDTPDMTVLVKKTRSPEPDAIDYRIRTPQLPDRQTAGALCSKVRAAGHPDCLVILHNPRVWAGVDVPGSSRVASSSPSGSPAVNFPAGAVSGSYRLQLASYRTKRNADRGKTILKNMLSGRTIGLDVMVRRPKNNDPAAFNYQVRTGPIESRDQAIDVCNTLRKAGHNGCLVIRHDGLKWRNVASADSTTENAARVSANSDAKSGDVKPGLVGSGDIKSSRLKTGHLRTDRPAASQTAKVETVESEVAAVPAQQPAGAPAASDDDDPAWPSYRVQLASFRTASGAAKGQAVLRKLLGDRNLDLDIMVRKDRRDSPQAFDFKIRTTPIKSRTEGNGICDVLRKAGHLGCLVIQHDEQLWNNLAEADERKNASISPLNGPATNAPIQPLAGAADPVNLIIELPGETVMESGIAGFAPETTGPYPAIPVSSPPVETEV